MKIPEIILFALNSSHQLGLKIARKLGVTLSLHEENDFEDGEHAARPLVNVQGKTVFVIHSLYSDTNENIDKKLCRLLFFIGALHDASAKHIVAVIPYLGYSRQDRKIKCQDPVTTHYIAFLLESVGTDHVITVDVHNIQAFQNSFRCSTDHLEAKNLFVNYLQKIVNITKFKNQNIVVMSPDIGGIKRAEQFRIVLEKKLNIKAGMVFTEKLRHEERIIDISEPILIGDIENIENKTVIIVDDLISSGKTILRAVNACKNKGAENIYAVITHGLFVKNSNQILKNVILKKIIITNTIVPSYLTEENTKHKITTIDISSLLANAILYIQSNGAPSKILKD